MARGSAEPTTRSARPLEAANARKARFSLSRRACASWPASAKKRAKQKKRSRASKPPRQQIRYRPSPARLHEVLSESRRNQLVPPGYKGKRGYFSATTIPGSPAQRPSWATARARLKLTGRSARPISNRSATFTAPSPMSTARWSRAGRADVRRSQKQLADRNGCVDICLHFTGDLGRAAGIRWSSHRPVHSARVEKRPAHETLPAAQNTAS